MIDVAKWPPEYHCDMVLDNPDDAHILLDKVKPVLEALGAKIGFELKTYIAYNIMDDETYFKITARKI